MRILNFFLLVLVQVAIASCNSRTATSTDEPTVDTLNVASKEAVSVADKDTTYSGCAFVNSTVSLGKGLVIVPDTFEIFNDRSLKDQAATIRVHDDTNIPYCSKIYKPDYGIMHFVSVDETDQTYEVLIGFSDHKFLPKKKGYQYKTWGEYILSSYGLRRRIDLKTKQPLRKDPSTSSSEVAIPEGHEMFCPVEVLGDWVKVKYDCFYDSEEQTGEPCTTYIDKCDQSATGWLKWRNDNELLIDIFLMP